MENKQNIKRLLERHLKRELSVAETNELFDRLRTIHRPEELDAYFYSRWNVDRTEDSLTDLVWEDIMQENSRRSLNRSKSLRQTRVRKLWQWGVAASMLLIISLVWWNWDTAPAYATYTTDFGETKSIVLDDGTTVILNANSQLVWKTDWKKDKIRHAHLQGEGYFKVSYVDLDTGLKTGTSDPDQRMSFKVKTSDVVIDVLGTTFNVAERRGETQVYLEEGSVQIGLLEKKISQNNPENTTKQKQADEKVNPLKMVLMEPGESVLYSAETKNLNKNKPIQSTAMTEWKDGTLVYQDVLFGDMLDHLEDIYGKEFEVQDEELLEKHINFGVPYEDWGTVQNVMERTLGVDIVSNAENKAIIKKRIE